MMEIRKFDTDNVAVVAVTVMRNGREQGIDRSELKDGNTIPRLCQAFGETACAQTCQLPSSAKTDVMCAESNITTAIEGFGSTPERFLIVSATEDTVKFGDDLDESTVSPEGYGILPASNAFFFRPGIDIGPSGEPLDTFAMRMADCGSVNFKFRDKNQDVVLGQAHFSRPNMRGPSAFKHDLVSGEKVSWAEHILEQAIEHYGADPSNIKIFLTAAVEGKDFIHNYDSTDKMEEHFAGWSELGFMHRDDKTGDTLIDYREMIAWQIKQAKQRFGLREQNLNLDQAVNTGDLSLGHASHHWASKGAIVHGRDMYVIGNDMKFKHWKDSNFDFTKI